MTDYIEEMLFKLLANHFMLIELHQLVQENLKNINKELSLVLDRFEKLSNHEVDNEKFSIGLDGIIV